MNRLLCLAIMCLLNYFGIVYFNTIAYIVVFVLFLNPMITNIFNEIVLGICYTYEADEGYIVKVYFKNELEKKLFIENSIKENEND